MTTAPSENHWLAVRPRPWVSSMRKKSATTWPVPYQATKTKNSVPSSQATATQPGQQSQQHQHRREVVQALEFLGSSLGANDVLRRRSDCYAAG